MIEVLKFSAKWCQPCVLMEPVWKKIAVNDENTNFLKIDIDDNPEEADRHKITAVPTVVILKDGIEVSRLVGMQTESSIQFAIGSAR